ncbi:MAG TPA: L-serine ammonia-lyase [Steroidobacteraceae bacterium]|nr:L-serine ammonia-lyase [Steroidobacteraceae bacterium]
MEGLQLHVSIFDLFKIGIGPSSSHTMGPMTAAHRFVREVHERGQLGQVARVTIDLYGSLALTGKGHATDTAVTLGIAGWLPAQVDPDAAAKLIEEVRQHGKLQLAGSQSIEFKMDRDIHWRYKESLPYHPNALTLHAYDAQGGVLHEGTFYSVGGGFVVTEAEAKSPTTVAAGPAIPFPYDNAEELLVMAEREKVRIADIMMRNECVARSEQEVRDGLDRIWSAMSACMDRGMREEGVLPGGLNVKRRAKKQREALEDRERNKNADPLIAMDWINVWALAVNEENAAGGKVVTAPTNGAAGLVPAVLRYYDRYCNGTPEGRHTFLLTAAAIGALYKRNASISAAEVGCQGEIGVACSIAAAGLTAAQGGSNQQIENAAEIGMEHNLGLTCDPIRGLVQIPCIERNAMGAVKAIDAARLALMGDGTHHVTLDRVIETMRRTGADMRDSYKETSLGGLAVNLPEC